MIIALHPWQGKAVRCFKHLASSHVFEVMFAVRMTVIPQHRELKICLEWSVDNSKKLTSYGC